jgi:NCS1 family nucleobase:cation symporter-1
MVIYGEAIWSPVALLDKFLDGKPSNATRFGVCKRLVIGKIFD